MLKDGVVLAVICLIAVGALAVWWIKAPAHALSATEPQVQETAPIPEPAPVVKRVSKPKPSPQPFEEQPVAEVAAVNPPPAPVVQTPALPFPAVDQIASGAHGDVITNTYGNPALSAMTFADGHVVETFVYSRDRGRTSTIIRLEDGKVATAYSRAEPSLPAGLSAPRRFPNR